MVTPSTTSPPAPGPAPGSSDPPELPLPPPQKIEEQITEKDATQTMRILALVMVSSLCVEQIGKIGMRNENMISRHALFVSVRNPVPR